MGIRPEHFDIGGGDGAWEGRITLVERLGHGTVLRVNVPDAGALTVSLDGQHEHRVGDILHLRPRPGFIHRFDATGRPIAA